MLKSLKLLVLFLVIVIGCGRKIRIPREKSYSATKQDRRILREIKNEDRKADKIARKRQKDKN